MDVLGHSQIGLTLDTYSHLLPERRREIADRVADEVEGSAARGGASSVVE
jgi:hypothetical protein